MTKKKTIELETIRDQILAIDREILLLDLDRKILIKDFIQRALTDEVIPIVEEIPSVIIPITPEEHKEIIIDSITTKADL